MPENKTNKLVGHNYTTPDLIAKVTGKAKYAEDYRVDGMLFAKLLLSPMPHARVVRIDTRAAAAMPGVKAILTVDDLPPVVEGANLGEGIIASTLSERGLTNEPLYVGDPVLAVAAVDELTATEAIRRSRSSSSRCPSSWIPLRACGRAVRTPEPRATCGCGRRRRRPDSQAAPHRRPRGPRSRS